LAESQNAVATTCVLLQIESYKLEDYIQEDYTCGENCSCTNGCENTEINYNILILGISGGGVSRFSSLANNEIMECES
jgi:hypothetical protein